MATNSYFTQGYQQEQDLYESLILESISIYGQEFYFLPRTVISEIELLGEPAQSKFDSYHEIEMYVESVDGFGGEGNLFSKFGIEIRDQMNLIVSKKRWKEQIGYEIDRPRPYEGDLIYFPLSKSLLEIKFVEHEQPFYQLNNLPVYQLQCELFEYSGEALNTGIHEVDKMEYTYGSGGVKMLLDLRTLPVPQLNRITLGEFYTQGEASGKLYSIAQTDDSPQLYEVSFGQVVGDFNVSVSSLLIGNDSGLEFEIKTIYGLDNNLNLGLEESLIDEDLFPTDVQAQNVSIEQEADDIIDFSEDNPFGSF